MNTGKLSTQILWRQVHYEVELLGGDELFDLVEFNTYHATDDATDYAVLDLTLTLTLLGDDSADW